MKPRRGVRMAVIEASEEILVYAFESPAEAGEMMAFLKEFLPDAEFVIEPLVN